MATISVSKRHNLSHKKAKAVAEGGMLMGELKQIEAASSDQRGSASARPSSSDASSPPPAQPAH